MRVFVACLLLCGTFVPPISVGSATLPDGRTIAPTGFTIPVEGFPSNAVLSPDGGYLAVVSQDGGAIDVLDTRESLLVERLKAPSVTNVAWTTDGLFLSRGYTGKIEHYTFTPADGKRDAPAFTKVDDIDAGGPGLVNGIAEDAATHRLLVARTADKEVRLIDISSNVTLATLATSGQPFDVGFAGDGFVATNYNGDRVDLWANADAPRTSVVTGPHPTRLLVDGKRIFVANADGHDVVAIDAATQRVSRRYELAAMADQPPGQTPSGMALAADGTTLFVCESGFNDVAVVDTATGAVRTRIPTGWYPMAVATLERSTVGKKDPRKKQQVWIVSARGLGQQPNPGGEWNGHMFGLVQHLIVDPTRFAAWSAQVARSDRFALPKIAGSRPPIEHVVFIVVENKHFDEEFGDEPRANADPSLLVYGRKYTPNLHALAERYTIFDEFMGNGDASIYGHSWLVQGMTNDYHERNARSRDESSLKIAHRVPFSIWPYAEAGEDEVTPATMDRDWYTNLADLPGGPRTNVSAIFGPRGELIDELQRRKISYRVYGEQMTMLANGRIAPGLAEHADREYPGTHINFKVLDTERARMFERDLNAHGLPAYTFMTLPTDHTAGSAPGLYTPESYIANNDRALGEIVATLSKRPEWKSTVVFVSPDDAQGTGDHVNAKRMPVIAIGPYVKRGAVDDTLYSFPSILRTVEVLFGAKPLNIEDAASPPILDAFATTPDLRPYAPLPESIAMTLNPGKAVSFDIDIDGPGSAAIPDQEWAAVHGATSLARHHAYLARLGTMSVLAARGVERGERSSER